MTKNKMWPWPSTERAPREDEPLTWPQFEKKLNAGALELEPAPSAELLAEFREAFTHAEDSKPWREWASELEQHAPVRDTGDGQGAAGDSSGDAGEHATRKGKRKR
jgi:hypothetical protein